MSESEENLKLRKELLALVNGGMYSYDEAVRRQQLEEEWGTDNVWDTKELSEVFKVEGFMAPFCQVIRKSDGAKGLVMFLHHPRFYYGFEKA